jgi:1-acyl-sn-glycerol-3-phosphate acyltransferase
MRFFKLVRACMAVVFVIVWNLVVAGALWLLAYLATRFRIVRQSTRIKNALLLFVTRFWVLGAYGVGCLLLMGMRHQDRGSFQRPEPGQPWVLIENHPSYKMTLAFGWFLGFVARVPYTVVMRDDILKTNPLLAFLVRPVALLGGALFITRDNGPKALRQITASMQAVGSDRLFVIFPDRRRVTPARIRADQDRFVNRLEGTDLQLTNTLFPSRGGLSRILLSLREAGHSTITVTDLTLAACERDDGLGIWRIDRLVGVQVLRVTRDVTSVFNPEHADPDTFADYVGHVLVLLFARKNELLRDAQGGPLVDSV